MKKQRASLSAFQNDPTLSYAEILISWYVLSNASIMDPS